MVPSPLNPNKIISICVFAFIACIIDAENQHYSSESDRVIKLPGQPSNAPVSQCSGYITVNEAHGRALFYWFFEALFQPTQKPLLLWLNGGPGCSSIGYGAAVELGPLLVSKKGSALEFNEHSWIKEANLLFVESPVGVGFSYSNTSSDYRKLDDQFVAEDAYNFLVNWLKKFLQFKSHEFYISGESYAGHYVPQLAELVYDRNKQRQTYPYINLKGFIVGNPETNDYYDYKGLLEYAWSHSVISDQEYNKARQDCNFKQDNWSTKCTSAMSTVFNRYEEIDIYNIYTPSCILNKTSSSSSAYGFTSETEFPNSQNYGFRRMKRIPGGYDPCYSTYTEAYFNRIEVQTALNVKSRGRDVKWTVCSDSVFSAYKYTVFSVFPIYKKLIKGGLKIWIYSDLYYEHYTILTLNCNEMKQFHGQFGVSFNSGDADGRVPVIGSRYCIEALNLPLKTPWTSWFHNHQVAGRIVEYEGLTFVTVRGAGHLVPLNKPSEALVLIHSFLSGEKLGTHR